MLCYRCGIRLVPRVESCSHCGAVVPVPMAPEPEFEAYVGAKVEGRYHLLELVDFDGFGVTYRANDRHLAQEVAIKLIHLEFAESEKHHRLFSGQTALCKRFNHPNICRLFDDGTFEGRPFWVSQYLEGISLRQLITERQQESRLFNPSEVESVVAQVGLALQYAHSATVHAALCPENIVVLSNMVKLTDFGLFRGLPRQQFLNVYEHAGPSFYYLAPEIRNDRAQLQPTVDIYSLGVLIGEMLTGVVYDDGAPEYFYSVAPGYIGKPLLDLLGLCFAQQPYKRCNTVSQLLEDFFSSMGGDSNAGNGNANELTQRLDLRARPELARNLRENEGDSLLSSSLVPSIDGEFDEEVTQAFEVFPDAVTTVSAPLEDEPDLVVVGRQGSADSAATRIEAVFDQDGSSELLLFHDEQEASAPVSATIRRDLEHLAQNHSDTIRSDSVRFTPVSDEAALPLTLPAYGVDGLEATPVAEPQIEEAPPTRETVSVQAMLDSIDTGLQAPAQLGEPDGRRVVTDLVRIDDDVRRVQQRIHEATASTSTLARLDRETRSVERGTESADRVSSVKQPQRALTVAEQIPQLGVSFWALLVQNWRIAAFSFGVSLLVFIVLGGGILWRQASLSSATIARQTELIERQRQMIEEMREREEEAKAEALRRKEAVELAAAAERQAEEDAKQAKERADRANTARRAAEEVRLAAEKAAKEANDDAARKAAQRRVEQARREIEDKKRAEQRATQLAQEAQEVARRERARRQREEAARMEAEKQAQLVRAKREQLESSRPSSKSAALFQEPDEAVDSNDDPSNVAETSLASFVPAQQKKSKQTCPAGMTHVNVGAFMRGSKAVGSDVRRYRSVDVASFCIDYYEYPNGRGKKPMASLSWQEAKARCEKRGKRLCSEDEWEKACKGPEGLKYPYGNQIKNDACNLDSSKPEGNLLSESGTFRGCRSGYNVFDLSGNVAEWTASKQAASGYVVKGGSVVGNQDSSRCAAREIINEESSDYIGFRCCLDAADLN